MQKNAKERKERNVLLKRTDAQPWKKLKSTYIRSRNTNTSVIQEVFTVGHNESNSTSKLKKDKRGQ